MPRGMSLSRKLYIDAVNLGSVAEGEDMVGFRTGDRPVGPTATCKSG